MASKSIATRVNVWEQPQNRLCCDWLAHGCSRSGGHLVKRAATQRSAISGYGGESKSSRRKRKKFVGTRRYRRNTSAAPLIGSVLPLADRGDVGGKVPCSVVAATVSESSYGARCPESATSLMLVILLDRKSTRLNSSHSGESRMPSSA